jgi:hypothetical protein
MRTIAVQLRTSCRKCGSPLPLNAMVPRLSCAACGGQNELDDAFWTSVLGEDDLSTSTIITDSREIALELSRPKEPACAACGAGIPAAGALAAAEAGFIACPACAVRTLLPGISPLDPTTFVAVPLVLALIALLSSWFPGRRAGKVDAMVALRYE